VSPLPPVASPPGQPAPPTPRPMPAQTGKGEAGKGGTPAKSAGGAKGAGVDAPSRKKLSYNEQRELDGMEAKIHEAEDEVKRLEAAMADPSTAADRRKMDEVCRKLGEAQQRVATMYERWTELEAKRG